MVTDPIADLLTRIRNAQRIGQRNTIVSKSNTAERVLNVLKEEGFITGFSSEKTEGNSFEHYSVELKYYPNGDPLIVEAKRMSKPGRRHYSKHGDLPQVHRGLGVCLVSTSAGVMSDRQARKQGVGGEILAFISS
ncbi:MAG: 30S ribosomal protein S8 [Bdellovibrionales bacterium]|nr:30S ribosomal protein S8 [Bdellovibrionales bacterium]